MQWILFATVAVHFCLYVIFWDIMIIIGVPIYLHKLRIYAGIILFLRQNMRLHRTLKRLQSQLVEK